MCTSPGLSECERLNPKGAPRHDPGEFEASLVGPYCYLGGSPLLS